MARKKIKLTPALKKFVRAIRTKLAPVQITLFGSRARGDAFNHSDWDFLVLSEKFEGVSFRDRIDQVLELANGPLGQDVEPFCFTPVEIKTRKNELGLVSTALKTGIRIA